MGTNIGYIGTDRHRRDPYFVVASELDVTITTVYGPGRWVDVENIAVMDDRPDEITTEGQDMADLTGGVVVYEDPHELVFDADTGVARITCRSDEMLGTIKSAIENGVHVVSEKPIARTAAGLGDIAERANELGVTVSPTMYYWRNPIAMTLRDRVSEGFLGDVWTFSGRFSASQFSYRDTDHYLYDREASRGDALQRTGPYWVDMIPWVLDDPTARVNARFHDAVEADVEAGAAPQFEIESGTLGTYHTGHCLSDRGRDTHLGFYGTKGQALTLLHHDSPQHEPTVSLDITSEHPDWTVAPKWAVEFELTYDRLSAWSDFVQDHFEDYFAGYETGDMPATTDDAVQLLRVLDVAYESGERSGRVEVEG